MDIARDLRWGRVDETLGEDPFLVAALGAAMVEGLRELGTGQLRGVVLRNTQTFCRMVTQRRSKPFSISTWASAIIGYGCLPFQKIIQQSKPATVMAAFNEIDGLPCHVNPWVLNDVLRNDWVRGSGVELSKGLIGWEISADWQFRCRRNADGPSVRLATRTT